MSSSCFLLLQNAPIWKPDSSIRASELPSSSQTSESQLDYEQDWDEFFHDSSSSLSQSDDERPDRDCNPKRKAESKGQLRLHVVVLISNVDASPHKVSGLDEDRDGTLPADRAVDSTDIDALASPYVVYRSISLTFSHMHRRGSILTYPFVPFQEETRCALAVTVSEKELEILEGGRFLNDSLIQLGIQ